MTNLNVLSNVTNSIANPSNNTATPKKRMKTLPYDFTFPKDDIPHLLQQTLKNTSQQLRKTEIKELISILFNKMIPFTGL